MHSIFHCDHSRQHESLNLTCHVAALKSEDDQPPPREARPTPTRWCHSATTNVGAMFTKINKRDGRKVPKSKSSALNSSSFPCPSALLYSSPSTSLWLYHCRFHCTPTLPQLLLRRRRCNRIIFVPASTASAAIQGDQGNYSAYQVFKIKRLPFLRDVSVPDCPTLFLYKLAPDLLFPLRLLRPSPLPARELRPCPFQVLFLWHQRRCRR